jgi:hypothetical protein
MQLGITLLTLVVYGAAGYLWWRDRTPIYVVALFAGQLGSLASPLWQVLYHFEYNPDFEPALLTLFGRQLPRVVFVAAWISVIPPLIIFILYKYRWWFPGYIPGILTFVVFVFYHLFFEGFGVRVNWWLYNSSTALPLGLQVTVLSALMNALVSLGILSLLLLTRRYALTSLLLLLLPMPLILNLFVHGLLGAPLYTVLLLQQRELASEWATLIGLIGTLGLIFWGAHIVASVIEGQQPARQAAG